MNSRYTLSPPERGSIHPNSRDIASEQAARIAPTTQRTRERPIEPTEEVTDPGVAKIPDPITLEIIRI